MNILIYGTGGVGGYFGGRIADAGYKVSMIARGEHLEAIQQNGLEVESINGNFRVEPFLATDDLSKVPSPDLIILGIKSWQIPKAAIALKPFVKEETMILPLQNGANNVENLLEVFPEKNIIGGLCNIVTFVTGPGQIKHASRDPLITFGELDNSKSERILQLKEIFDDSKITNIIPENIQIEIWQKFLFITTVSGLGGLTRASIDILRESEYLYDLMKNTAKEILAVANAKGIRLSQKNYDWAFEVIQKLPAGTTASTQRDIMNGKPSELENFNGYIVKEGKRLGIATPVNEFVYECLLPMEKKARAQ